MKHLLTAFFAATLLASSYSTFADDSNFTWRPLPPALSTTAVAALLTGRPNQPGLYILRVKMEKDGIILPHYHQDTRYVTVLRGTLFAGSGPDVNEANAKAYDEGSFFVVPAGDVHFSWAKDGDVEYQESGIGPTSNELYKR